MALDLFVGIPVTDYAAARPWYERFFGRAPSFLPNDTEAVWEVAGHVYAAVFGDAIPHLHVHLLPRFPGTPGEYWGTHVNKWPQARRGGTAEIAALVQDLRRHLSR